MGLDISVYKNIKESDEEFGSFKAFVSHEPWKHKVKNLKYDKWYSGDRVFRGISYSYSTHYYFRVSLLKLINRLDLLDEKDDILWSSLPNYLPFFDFIYFSDCEGCLDWEVSNKLYSDFNNHLDIAKSCLTINDLYRYETWLETFKIAKDNGVVVYH